MNLKLSPLMIALLFWLSACGGTEEPTTATTPTPQAAAGHAEGKEEGGYDEEGGHIELTPEQLKATGIKLVQAGPAQIRENLPLYGVIAPNAERVREVAARFPGVIQSVAKKIGDPVREGETLATVEANESLQTYAVTAPLSGVVTARNANPGEQTGDKTLFTVADLSTVWVELSLFPRDVAKVRIGQGVRVKNNEVGLEAMGKVVYVAPFGQSVNQTLTARVLLDNPERRWAPGLYVTAEVTLAETTALLAIRNEAVQTLEGRSVVFVQGAEGFAPREVALGRSDGEHSEVTSGLAAGDTYAAANSFILKAELGKGAAAHED
nr:efflux RND transporter periplasmic adaptor subunit [Nitrosomonas nitrosa]